MNLSAYILRILNEKRDELYTHPVLCCLPNKGTLTTTRTRVSLNWMTSRPDQIIELGKFDDERVPVILVERSFFEIVLDERRFEWHVCLFLNEVLVPRAKNTLSTYVVFL